MWSHVPGDVLDIVLDKLHDDEDVWTCLALNSCWARSAIATERLQVVDSSHLTMGKQLVAAMSRRKRLGFEQLDVKFAGVSTSVLGCSALLTELSCQVASPGKNNCHLWSLSEKYTGSICRTCYL